MEGLIFWVVAGAVLVFMVRRTKRKAREARALIESQAEAARDSTSEPIPEPLSDSPPDPAPTPAPVGQWRSIESESAEFEYLGEGGERLSVGIVMLDACDSHFSGLSLEPDENIDDRAFAFERVVGRVHLPESDEVTDAEELRRRLLASAEAVAGTSAAEPEASGPSSGNLLFEYKDSRGKVSTRELSSWSVKGNTLRGYCLDREAIRTFRLDRVARVIEGQELLEASRHTPARATTARPDKARKGAPEILFTGFDSKSRQVLEATAESHGFLVRKSVTKNLDVLVRGPRPSQSKLAAADDKPGCSVVDKEGFLWMMTTGEITS